MNQLQILLGHHFQKPTLLEQALRHRSCGRLNNERLEFLGDAILNFVVADFLYKDFATLPEGNMSRVRAALVNREALVKIADSICVHQYIKTGVMDTKKYHQDGILADTMEAIFAAVYLDAGHEKTKQVICHHVSVLLEKGEVNLRKDPKSALQEKLQAKGLPLPLYTVTEQGAGMRFRAVCDIPALHLRGTGHGITKKQAEAAAASEVFQKV